MDSNATSSSGSGTMNICDKEPIRTGVYGSLHGQQFFYNILQSCFNIIKIGQANNYHVTSFNKRCNGGEEMKMGFVLTKGHAEREDVEPISAMLYGEIEQTLRDWEDTNGPNLCYLMFIQNESKDITATYIRKPRSFVI